MVWVDKTLQLASWRYQYRFWIHFGIGCVISWWVPRIPTRDKQSSKLGSRVRRLIVIYTRANSLSLDFSVTILNTQKNIELWYLVMLLINWTHLAGTCVRMYPASLGCKVTNEGVYVFSHIHDLCRRMWADNSVSEASSKVKLCLQ